MVPTVTSLQKANLDFIFLRVESDVMDPSSEHSDPPAGKIYVDEENNQPLDPAYDFNEPYMVSTICRIVISTFYINDYFDVSCHAK